MNRTAEITTAREVDTRIAAAWNLYYDTMAEAATERATIKSALKMVRGMYPHPGTKMNTYYNGKIANAENRIAVLQAEALVLAEDAEAMNKALYKGWTRFFLVQHIHSSQHCSSFRPRTRIGWLPDVSGLTEAEAVAAHGEALCTICFPSAPTALTTKPADPSVCTGTRNYDAPSRTGYFSGNWATCTCGQQVTVTSAGNLRKHKVA